MNGALVAKAFGMDRAILTPQGFNNRARGQRSGAAAKRHPGFGATLTGTQPRKGLYIGGGECGTLTGFIGLIRPVNPGWRGCAAYPGLLC